MLGGCFYSFCWHSGYCIFYSAYVVPTGFWIDCKSKLQKAGIPWKFRIYGRFGCNTHKGCNSSMVYGNLHIALPSPPGRGGGVPSWKTLNMWKKLSPCNATFVWRPSTGRSRYVNIRIYIYIHVIYRPLERSLKVNSSWITKYTWISDGSYQICFFLLHCWFSVNGIWPTWAWRVDLIRKVGKFLSTTLLPYSCLKYPEKKTIHLAFKEQNHGMVNHHF